MTVYCGAAGKMYRQGDGIRLAAQQALHHESGYHVAVAVALK
jgi:hypothetical protein